MRPPAHASGPARTWGRRTFGRGLLAAAAGMACWGAGAAGPPAPQAYTVVGDAIPEPLTAQPGDAVRGRAIVADRRAGLCLLCHAAPIDEEPFQGTLAPSLAGAGTRWSTGQLRLRIADSRRLDPVSIMPPFHRIEGLQRVGTAWQGRPILTAQQVEDVVAYLVTLRD